MIFIFLHKRFNLIDILNLTKNYELDEVINSTIKLIEN